MRNTDIRIRDPYIVADKETNQYFLFGTTDSDPWNGEGEGFKVYRSENLEEWWRKDMHSDHRKTFGQIRTFGHRRCISILENGI